MDCIMIGIAGRTGSGKSTFTNRLKKRLAMILPNTIAQTKVTQFIQAKFS